MQCLYILSEEKSEKQKHIQYIVENYKLKIDLECVMKSYRYDKIPSAQFYYMLTKYYNENKK
jgi:hypothetical protein